jgi:hypothetical protein
MAENQTLILLIRTKGSHSTTSADHRFGHFAGVAILDAKIIVVRSSCDNYFVLIGNKRRIRRVFLLNGRHTGQPIDELLNRIISRVSDKIGYRGTEDRAGAEQRVMVIKNSGI